MNVPGSQSLIDNAATIDVQVVSGESGLATSGRVHRPGVLAALVGKAAATAIAVRANRERDWEDAALLLTILPDPVTARTTLRPGEKRRLARISGLMSPDHAAWSVLPVEARRRGQAAAQLLLG